MWSHFSIIFSLLFLLAFFEAFWEDSGGILEPFWSSKSMKNPLKIRWSFLLIFEWFLGGFLETFLEGFLMKNL